MKFKLIMKHKVANLILFYFIRRKICKILPFLESHKIKYVTYASITIEEAPT